MFRGRYKGIQIQLYLYAMDFLTDSSQASKAGLGSIDVVDSGEVIIPGQPSCLYWNHHRGRVTVGGG